MLRLFQMGKHIARGGFCQMRGHYGGIFSGLGPLARMESAQFDGDDGTSKHRHPDRQRRRSHRRRFGGCGAFQNHPQNRRNLDCKTSDGPVLGAVVLETTAANRLADLRQNMLKSFCAGARASRCPIAWNNDDFAPCVGRSTQPRSQRASIVLRVETTRRRLPCRRARMPLAILRGVCCNCARSLQPARNGRRQSGASRPSRPRLSTN